ncbi:MAG: hypothetical protein HQL38_00360 [Alphaproteobacteria bacterium]|nr:hypothetical protein [Alphaproteobacteria bacterium]
MSRALLLALAVPLALSACAKKDEPPPCPKVAILGDAARLTKFRPGPGRDVTDVEIEAEMSAFRGECQYKDEGVEVSLAVAVDARRGPGAPERVSDLDWFVAVPVFYPKPEAKAVIKMSVGFPVNVETVRATDEGVTMLLPYRADVQAQDYQIFVGFQLTPEQLEYNRRHGR